MTLKTIRKNISNSYLQARRGLGKLRKDYTSFQNEPSIGEVVEKKRLRLVKKLNRNKGFKKIKKRAINVRENINWYYSH